MNWSRPEAEALLFEWTQSPGLRGHARAVEEALRAYARKYGEDEELWGLTGLLHDLDYERHPTRGCSSRVGVAHLREKGAPEVMLQAILGHAEYLDVPRETRLAKALFAVDELVGLITAVALSRALEESTGLRATIKWPNDLLWEGKKFCGILAQNILDNYCPFPFYVATSLFHIRPIFRRIFWSLSVIM